MEPEGLLDFLSRLEIRANDYGWNFEQDGLDFDDQGVLTISTDPDDPNADRFNLIRDHGQIDIDTIRDQEERYIDDETRRVQDNQMIRMIIMISILKEGRKKINVWKQDFTIGENVSGPLLLKVTIRESHIDSNATTTSIRDKLGALDLYMATVGNEIGKFNAYVTSLVSQLRSRGQTSSDLLNHILKGYKACSDKQFVKYIEGKE